MSLDVGDYVSAGTTIAQVDAELKKTALAAANVGLDKAKSDLARYSQLVGDLAVSDQQMEGARLALRSAEIQVASASRLLRDTRITAPVSGIITARHSPRGSNVMPGTPIVTIVDVSQLKVRVNVAERDVFKLRVGDRVDITTDVHPGMTFVGRIESISPKSDEAHTYPVEIGVTNSGSKLKAGMFGRVAFSQLGEVNTLVIPRGALVGSIQKPQVFVVNNGVAYLRSIVVAGESGTNVLVESGLLAGDQIVIDGQNNLTDKAAVSIVK
jgi:RND family efflux transporter MFP subunit